MTPSAASFFWRGGRRERRHNAHTDLAGARRNNQPKCGSDVKMYRATTSNMAAYVPVYSLRYRDEVVAKRVTNGRARTEIQNETLMRYTERNTKKQKSIMAAIAVDYEATFG